MNGFVISLLIVVLLLWLLKELLAVIGLPEPASRIVWIIAIIVAVIYLLAPGFIVR